MIDARNLLNRVKASPSKKTWDSTRQRSFLDDLGEKLQITDKSSWYNISHSTLAAHGGSGLVRKYDSSLLKMFRTVYPEYPTYLINEGCNCK